MRRTALVCGIAAAAIGLVVMLGWAAGLQILTTFGGAFYPTAPNMGISLLLLGTALTFLAAAPASNAAKSAATAAAAGAVLLGAAEAVELLAGLDHPVERFLVPGLTGSAETARSAMSPFAAASVLLLGAAIIMVTWSRRQRVVGAAGMLASVAGLIAIVHLFGYLYGSAALYGGTVKRIALPATLACLLLSTGAIVVHGPAQAVARPFTGPSARARLLRALLPIIFGMTLLQGLMHRVTHTYLDVAEPLVTASIALIVAAITAAVISQVAGVIGGEIDRAESARDEAEEGLRAALAESARREREVTALFEGSRAVLRHQDFSDAARSIFDTCKALVGATAGYVALFSEGGDENQVVFHDAGGLPCAVDPNLPMPIRGLSAEAHRSGRAVCENDFSAGRWAEFVPSGHVAVKNVLFAPLLIGGKTAGLLGLANKPTDFNAEDLRIAEAFGELAAIALVNSRTLESLEHSTERFRVLATTANDAIVSANGEGKITFWNVAAENMFGYSAAEAEGRPVSGLMREDFRNARRRGRKRVVTAGPLKIVGQTIDGIGVRKDGSEFPIETSIAKWHTAEGVFFTSVIRDISERKRAEEDVRKINADLKKRTDQLQERNLEISTMSRMGETLQLCRSTEEAYAAVAQFAEELLVDVPGAIYVLSSSRNLLESVTVWGGSQDVETVFSPDDCWGLRSGHPYVASAATHQRCRHVSVPGAYMCAPMVAQGETLGIMHVRFPEPAIRDGSVFETKRRIVLGLAERAGLALANLRMREKMQNLSIRDPLTGLFNRRYLQESIEREVLRAQRKGESLGMIMADLDHFKEFNDTYGHEAGDTLLRQLGMVMRNSVRESDIPCRYGGEEFLLILPDATVQTAFERAERLRSAFKRAEGDPALDLLRGVTISLGVAAYPRDGTSADDVIRAADAALYRAKRLGRDRVCVAGEEETHSAAVG